MPPKALFPRAWKYYNTVVAIISALIVLGNAIIIQVDHEVSEAWVAAIISFLAAVLIWLRDRRQALGLDENPSSDIAPL